MGHYSTVGQSTHSHACGYFCGFLLGLVRQQPGAPANWMMEVPPILASRDSYETSSGVDCFLWAHRAPGYLDSVGATGYTYYPFRNTHGGNTAQYLFDTINPALGPGSGAMLLLGGGVGDSAGHWVAILYKDVRGQNTNWHYYDPNGPVADYDTGLRVAGALYQNVTFVVHV